MLGSLFPLQLNTFFPTQNSEATLRQELSLQLDSPRFFFPPTHTVLSISLLLEGSSLGSSPSQDRESCQKANVWIQINIHTPGLGVWVFFKFTFSGLFLISTLLIPKQHKILLLRGQKKTHHSPELSFLFISVLALEIKWIFSTWKCYALKEKKVVGFYFFSRFH